MARLYADENFPRAVVDHLRSIGHDVLTCREDGRANRKIDDPDVLARAHELGRAVLTLNRGDFRRLHLRAAAHGGMVLCTDDRDYAGQAGRIDAAIRDLDSLVGLMIRVNRPSR